MNEAIFYPATPEQKADLWALFKWLEVTEEDLLFWCSGANGFIRFKESLGLAAFLRKEEGLALRGRMTMKFRCGAGAG